MESRNNEDWDAKEEYGDSIMDDAMHWVPNFRVDAFPPGCLTIVRAQQLPFSTLPPPLPYIDKGSSLSSDIMLLLVRETVILAGQARTTCLGVRVRSCVCVGSELCCQMRS